LPKALAASKEWLRFVLQRGTPLAIDSMHSQLMSEGYDYDKREGLIRCGSILEKDGYNSDPVNFFRFMYVKSVANLGIETHKKKPDVSRVALLAYWAGEYAMQVRHHQQETGKGRRRVESSYLNQINVAHLAWKKRNPKSKQRPRAKDLQALMPSPVRVSTKRFANLVSGYFKAAK
jgi:hypothetical protein